MDNVAILADSGRLIAFPAAISVAMLHERDKTDPKRCRHLFNRQ
jgi:hypothetical protein